ncbi:MAG: hypothetical protein CMC52_00320 [Flavobacteriaceae bacterium]|jgi:succinate dehydrogenase flavin-adding protein (antitoxin of CptAB toxin-antitoxin module)|nr:hypothetical protein [Flavobacteriaceae bacterium]|tara:strand:+ start:8337 stop:8600 length:264 start_codon:yes stop_codon:yes gene_type:complete
MTEKENLEIFSKAKFKSRRGLNELDQIFVPFVLEQFNNLDSHEKKLFIKLLEWEDIDLADIILYKKEIKDMAFEEVFKKIIKFSSEI